MNALYELLSTVTYIKAQNDKGHSRGCEQIPYSKGTFCIFWCDYCVCMYACLMIKRVVAFGYYALVG